MADVGGQHLKQVVSGRPFVVKPQRGNPEPFLEDFGRRGVVSAVSAAAHIAVMGPVDPEKQKLALVEHGPNDGYVR